jgi:GNAT superfamily N-acetyltransferase
MVPSSSLPTGNMTGQPKGLRLNERLALIGLIDEGMRLGSSGSPIVPDLFNDLWDLVNATVSGSKIRRLTPKHSMNGFNVLEVNAETGENLGRLNMLYLKKPIPCYYLVYVEVAPLFRKKGLGHQILSTFRDFLREKSAVGILDNIIPEDDPTYDIYLKQAWEPAEVFVGHPLSDVDGNYMIYVPPGIREKDLREPVLRLLYHLRRKRAAIDMRDNQVMVQRTIGEFKELYSALLTYFGGEIRKGEATPLMRFMFTRFVTKLIAFRRRIGELVGYTGGESVEQLALLPEIASLKAKSYAPAELATGLHLVSWDSALWPRLPEELRNHPARTIESLPNYLRPSLLSWLENRGLTVHDALTIGDFVELGFDPTRLKEIRLGEDAFIIERIQSRQLPDLDKKKTLLEQVGLKMPGIRAGNARLLVNAPLMTIRDRGNAYVFRRKVEGIHWEEAVEQLQSAPHLRALNESLRLDRLVMTTVRKAIEMVAEQFGEGEESLQETLACFVSWDLRANRPRLAIDLSGTSWECLWLA